jgi:UDP-N-acetyl-D-glucosamine dehydrogenase
VTVKEALLAKIAGRDLQVGVVGLGYVGLPLAVVFAQAGFEVIGVDLDAGKVQLINGGQSPIGDVSTETLSSLVANGRLRATTDYEALRATGVIVICVPTPLRKTRDPDVSHIVAAADRVAHIGSAGKLIVLESTTYPGTTEEIILPRLSADGIVVGQDFFLAFSPERIDPGRTDYGLTNTPKVIGGITADCLEMAVAFYGTAVQQVVPVSSTAAAEMVKLLENTFRAVNIGLVNEMALMCDRLGLDVWEIVEAASTKPFGFMPFYPGPGMGGHCLPVDPHYLSWKLKTLNYEARFIELAAEINRAMPEYVAGKVADALNDIARPVRDSRILLLGVAYKPNVADIRESPALDVLYLLRDKGADVHYHDPYVQTLEEAGFPDESVILTAKTLREADCIVVITNHDGYDWPWIARQAKLIIDTRNALRGVPAANIISI